MWACRIDSGPVVHIEPWSIAIGVGLFFHAEYHFVPAKSEFEFVVVLFTRERAEIFRFVILWLLPESCWVLPC